MVTRWSAEAMAELRSIQRGSTAVVSQWVRSRAQQLANAAGRRQVERGDVSEAMGQYFDRHYAPAEGAGEPGDERPAE